MPPTTAVPDPFQGLEPQAVWKHFRALTRIPRPSGHEGQVRQYLERFARAQKFKCEANDVGDLLLRVHPRAAGPTIALQCHMDMVCVADEGVAIDFRKDPICVLREGDHLRAAGTSLGADDGIGMALALALAEDWPGPLELLFTTEEETSSRGVLGVGPGWLRAKRLINLDSEPEGIFFIGSAGSLDLDLELILPTEPAPAGGRSFELRLTGLRGGHSGATIGYGRSNAIAALCHLVRVLRDCHAVVHGLAGGSARNAIPDKAKAAFSLPETASVDFLRHRLEQAAAHLRTAADPGLHLEIAPLESRPDRVLAPSGLERLLRTVAQLPLGLLRRDPSDGFPLTSNNLGLLSHEDPNRYRLQMLARSALEADIDELGRYVEALSRQEEGTVVAGARNASWNGNRHSRLVQAFGSAFLGQTGRQPRLERVHAGLECGDLQRPYPDLEMISLGPDQENAHTTGEWLSISSTARTFALLREGLTILQRGA